MPKLFSFLFFGTINKDICNVLFTLHMLVLISFNVTYIIIIIEYQTYYLYREVVVCFLCIIKNFAKYDVYIYVYIYVCGL